MCVEGLMGNMEPIKLELEIPALVWHALTYYMRHTSYWICNDYEENSAKTYIIDMVKTYLEMEATNPQDAYHQIKHIMETEHLPNL